MLQQFRWISLTSVLHVHCVINCAGFNKDITLNDFAQYNLFNGRGQDHLQLFQIKD